MEAALWKVTEYWISLARRIGKPMKQENKDIVGEKYIRGDNDVIAFNEEDKKKA